MPKVPSRNTEITFHQPIFDGESQIFKMKERGESYQFMMWLPKEKKHYRRSLRTTDYDIALEKAKKLTKELMANGLSEQLVFSISVEKLIEQYIVYRENAIDSATGITHKRWLTLASQLKYLALTCGANTKLSDLKRDQLYEYSALRNKIKKCAILMMN